MEHLTEIELVNWMALYLAAGACSAIAVVLAAATTAVEIYRERRWVMVTSLRSALLFLPRTWWRWQKLYLLSMPTTLGIVLIFGISLNWS